MTKTVIRSPWFLWTLVTSIGSAVGFTIGGSLGGFFSDYYLPLFILVTFAICCLFMSFGQWMILRTKLTRAWGWMPATTFGLPLGFFIGFWVNEFLPRSLYVNEWIETWIMAGIAGVFTGLIQWLTLRRKLKDSLKWILMSALSWAVGINVTGFLFETYLSNLDFWYLNASISGLIIGALVGILSGVFVESTLMQTEHNGILQDHAS